MIPAPFDAMRKATKFPICRWCGRLLMGRRSSWCMDECQDAWLLTWDWRRVRPFVFKRDGGKCVQCGVDIKKLTRVARAFRDFVRDCQLSMHGLLAGAFHEWLGVRDIDRDLWECDHIVPRCLGGDNQPANLRVLCIPCHRSETAALARRRADQRRSQPDLLQGVAS